MLWRICRNPANRSERSCWAVKLNSSWLKRESWESNSRRLCRQWKRIGNGWDNRSVARNKLRRTQAVSSAIRTENLSKRFLTVRALRQLNLEIPQGAIYALVGPNGAGKTTMIKVLMNILHP